MNATQEPPLEMDTLLSPMEPMVDAVEHRPPAQMRAGSRWRTLRRIRNVPPGWQVLLVGLAVAVLWRVAPSVVPAVAAAGGLAVWHGLAPVATSHKTSERLTLRRRLTAFAAGLMVGCGFLVAAVLTLDAAVMHSAWRLPALVTGAGLTVSLMFATILRQWWRPIQLFAGCLALVAAGGGAVWLTLQQPPLPIGVEPLFVRNLVRLTLIVALATGLRYAVLPLTDSHRPVLWAIRNGGQTIMAAAVLALLGRPDVAVVAGGRTDATLWTLLTVGLAGFLALTLWRTRATLPGLTDWLGRFRRGGWPAAGPMPLALFLTVSLTPALILMPTASWTVWTLTLLLAGMAGSFKVVNDRLDPHLRPRRFATAVWRPAR